MNLCNEKIIFEIKEDDLITIKKYKSILEISKDFPNIPYHNLRGLYKYGIKKSIQEQTGKTAKLRIVNAMLNKKYKVYDNPIYINSIIDIMV